MAGYVAVFPQSGQEVRVGPYDSLWSLAADFDMDELEAERLGQSGGWNCGSVSAWLAALLGLPEASVRIEAAED